MSASVRCEVQATRGRGTGQGRVTFVMLEWDRVDPDEVLLTVVALPSHPALPEGCWSLRRTFLARGACTPAVVTGATVRPSEDGAEVWLEIETDGPALAVAVPRDDVVDFLARTA